MKQTDKKILSATNKTLRQRAVDRSARDNLSSSAVRTFKVMTQTPDVQPPSEQSKTLQEQLNNERLREIQFKNYFRMVASVFFAFLLAGQNIAVFYIIYLALRLNLLKDLQLIFATLVGATLTETYFITKIIINFIFSTTDYSSDKKS